MNDKSTMLFILELASIIHFQVSIGSVSQRVFTHNLILKNICPCFGLVLVERFTQRRYLACAMKLDRGNSTVIRQTVVPGYYWF